MIISTASGYIGPFKAVETLADRLRCDGTDLPFSVIGAYEVLEDDSLMPPPPAPPTPVPATVTRRQARQALLISGLLGAVPTAIAGIVDPLEKGLAEIFWADSQEFERNHPVLIQLATAIGLTSLQTDALFIQAAKL